MALEKNVEARIAEAIATGEFDNLPGKGKPLDLEAYFATPEHLRMGYSILKSANAVPEEALSLKAIEALEGRLAQTDDEEAKKSIRREIAEMEATFQMMLERRRMGR